MPLRLTVKVSGGAATTFDVLDDDVFIGRVTSINDVCLDDPSVSRQHACVKRREEGYCVYDMRSANGVFVNGEPVTRALLSDGDSLRIGTVELTVSLRSPTKQEELREIEEADPTVTCDAAVISKLLGDTDGGA